MKKSSDQSPAPKTVTKPASKARTVPPKVPAARAKPPVASAKAPAVPSKIPAASTKAPAVARKKSAAPARKKPVVVTDAPATVISAKIDVGLGNHLFLRGAGPGLSWDRGTAMQCVGTDLWVLTLKDATSPILFKLLVNDLNWSVGDDFAAAPGTRVTVVPTF